MINLEGMVDNGMAMGRRKFFCYLASGFGSFVGTISQANSSGPKSSQTNAYAPWVVLYWMPYDNDLARFGEPIINMLRQGTENTNAIVAVQSDYWGDRQMRRRKIVQGKIEEINILGEDSSNISALSDYLDWAHQQFDADHWAIIVVGHGGHINEISPDDHSTTTKVRTWMEIDQLADTVKDFNQKTGGRVELLFLQNCNKATLEVVYQTRYCAKYTLASQLLLGAPNAYYSSFLDYLNAPPNSGRDVGIAIIEAEDLEMYHTLTLIDNQALHAIPDQLSRVLQAIGHEQLPMISPLKLETHHYFGEQHCDLLAFLQYLSQVNNRGQAELAVFSQFLHSSVITHHQIGGKLYDFLLLTTPNLQQSCGLGLSIPNTAQDIAEYHSLALYQDTELCSLWR
jgi:hypothetical protein